MRPSSSRPFHRASTDSEFPVQIQLLIASFQRRSKKGNCFAEASIQTFEIYPAIFDGCAAESSSSAGSNGVASNVETQTHSLDFQLLDLMAQEAAFRQNGESGYRSTEFSGLGSLQMAPLPAGGVYIDRVATVKRHGFGAQLLAQALDNSKFALLFAVPKSRLF